MNAIEEWRSVPDWPAYEVSSLGRVRRVQRRQGGTVGACLKPILNHASYPVVTLRHPGRSKSWLVSRLVCTAFHGPPPTPKHEAAHWDGVPGNCAASNLRWATSAENHADKLRHGTDARGEKSPVAKLTNDAVRQIRAVPRGANLQSLADRFGVSVSTVKGARYGAKWKHVETA